MDGKVVFQLGFPAFFKFLVWLIGVSSNCPARSLIPCVLVELSALGMNAVTSECSHCGDGCSEVTPVLSGPVYLREQRCGWACGVQLVQWGRKGLLGAEDKRVLCHLLDQPSPLASLFIPFFKKTINVFFLFL